MEKNERGKRRYPTVERALNIRSEPKPIDVAAFAGIANISEG